MRLRSGRPRSSRRRPTVDSSVRLGPVELANPIVAASGTFGYGDEVARLCDPSTLGAVTVKSLAPYPWSGNPPPRLTTTAAGMLNSVGLDGPGGHDPDHVEDAQSVERAKDQNEKDHGLEQGQGERFEALPSRSAVDLGRRVNLLRDNLESGKQEQRGEGRGLPDVGKDDREHGETRLGEPGQFLSQIPVRVTRMSFITP